MLYLPDFFEVQWPSMQKLAAKDLKPYQISQIPPGSYETVQVMLEVGKGARFENPAAIFEVTYAWFPETGKAQQGSLYRSLGLRAGPIEDIGVSGVTLSLAIYFIPGLMALIVFALFVDLPKVVDDNKYLVGFVLSAAPLFLSEYFNIRLRTGSPLVDVGKFSFIGAGLGASLGGFCVWYKRRRLPAHERYPPAPGMNLATLLATYVRQTGSVESAPVKLQSTGGEKYSGLQVKQRNGKDLILLPRQYKVAGSDKLARELKDAYTKKNASRVATLLEQLADSLEVYDGSKKIDDGDEKMFEGSFRPQEISGGQVVGSEEIKELLLKAKFIFSQFAPIYEKGEKYHIGYCGEVPGANG